MDETGVTPGDVVDQQVQKNQAEEAARQESAQSTDLSQVLEVLVTINESLLSLKDSADRAAERQVSEPENVTPERPDVLGVMDQKPDLSISLEPLVQTVRELVEEVRGWKESPQPGTQAATFADPRSPIIGPVADIPERLGAEQKPLDLSALAEAMQGVKESLNSLQESNERILEVQWKPDQTTTPANSQAEFREQKLPELDLSPVTEPLGLVVEEIKGLRELLTAQPARSEAPIQEDRTPQGSPSDVSVGSPETSPKDDCCVSEETLQRLTEAIQKITEIANRPYEEKRSAEQDNERVQSTESRPVKPEAGGAGFKIPEEQKAPAKPDFPPDRPEVESRSQPIPSWQMQGAKSFPAQQTRQPTPASRSAPSSPQFASPMESQDQPDNSAVEKFQQVSQGLQRIIGTLMSQQGQIVEMSQTLLGIIDQTQARLDQMGSQIAQLTQAARGTGGRAQRNGRI